EHIGGCVCGCGRCVSSPFSGCYTAHPPRSPLPLHDALPICSSPVVHPIFNGPLAQLVEQLTLNQLVVGSNPTRPTIFRFEAKVRSEEHTSELQTRDNLVCRLLLEKKATKFSTMPKAQTMQIA